MRNQMHLMSFPEYLEGVHYALKQDLEQGRKSGFAGSSAIGYWQHVAKTLERGRFDGVFFADTGGIYDRYKGRADDAISYGVGWPKHDPIPILLPMCMATEHLGVAVTMSIANGLPYPAMRTLSTIDFLTDGRIGWNIVTGNSRMEYEAIGLEPLEHDARYDQADEYMDVCYALWSGIPSAAIVMNGESDVIADASRISRIDYKGKYVKSCGIPLVVPSRQGHPVLFQAGSSGRGQKFALRHADIIFSIQPDTAAMKSYVEGLVAQSHAIGRPSDPRVVFGIQVVVGSTEAEANRRREELLGRHSLEASLARLSGSLGVDLSKIDLDSPMEEWPTQASQGLVKAMSTTVGGRKLTLRDVAATWATSIGTPHIVGTPDQVADQIEEMWSVTGCYGFMVRPGTIPESIEEFVDTVVPRLQAKGVFRKEYEGKTFRENLLGESQP
jgi:long-chain alkane monooxygenase